MMSSLGPTALFIGAFIRECLKQNVWAVYNARIGDIFTAANTGATFARMQSGCTDGWPSDDWGVVWPHSVVVELVQRHRL